MGKPDALAGDARAFVLNVVALSGRHIRRRGSFQIPFPGGDARDIVAVFADVLLVLDHREQTGCCRCADDANRKCDGPRTAAPMIL